MKTSGCVFGVRSRFASRRCRYRYSFRLWFVYSAHLFCSNIHAAFLASSHAITYVRARSTLAQ